MDKYNAIKLFNDKRVRTVWDEEKEEWFFSVVDVCGALSETTSKDKGAYWRKLKQRLANEGSQLVTDCHGLKMLAEDGKMRKTDVLDTKGILRLVQSIPSPNAEPFKQWLAQVGSERLEEIADPEQAINRALLTYRRKGYSEAWINQRLKSIEVRKDLTDEWNRVGINKSFEYAILTDDITQAWSGLTTKEYKALKDLKKENLRDNMSNMELVLNMLAEATTTEISKSESPNNLSASREIARQGGKIAGNTRKEIEAKTKKAIVSSQNAQTLSLEEEK